MTYKKLALMIALPLLASSVSATAQTPAAQKLSMANHPAVAKDVRSGATVGRKSAAAGGNFLGYVLGAVVLGAFIWGGIELIGGDDNDNPASP